MRDFMQGGGSWSPPPGMIGLTHAKLCLNALNKVLHVIKNVMFKCLQSCKSGQAERVSLQHSVAERASHFVLLDSLVLVGSSYLYKY